MSLNNNIISFLFILFHTSIQNHFISKSIPPHTLIGPFLTVTSSGTYTSLHFLCSLLMYIFLFKMLCISRSMLPLASLVAAKCPSPSPLLRIANSTCYYVHQIPNTQPKWKIFSTSSIWHLWDKVYTVNWICTLSSV